MPLSPQAALAAPSPESVGAIAPKVLGIIGTKALKGFQVIWVLVFLLEPHQIVLSWVGGLARQTQAAFLWASAAT